MTELAVCKNTDRTGYSVGTISSSTFGLSVATYINLRIRTISNVVAAHGIRITSTTSWCPSVVKTITEITLSAVAGVSVLVAVGNEAHSGAVTSTITCARTVIGKARITGRTIGLVIP